MRSRNKPRIRVFEPGAGLTACSNFGSRGIVPNNWAPCCLAGQEERPLEQFQQICIRPSSRGGPCRGGDPEACTLLAFGMLDCLGALPLAMTLLNRRERKRVLRPLAQHPF